MSCPSPWVLSTRDVNPCPFTRIASCPVMDPWKAVSHAENWALSLTVCKSCSPHFQLSVRVAIPACSWVFNQHSSLWIWLTFLIPHFTWLHYQTSVPYNTEASFWEGLHPELPSPRTPSSLPGKFPHIQRLQKLQRNKEPGHLGKMLLS